jgi:hypothetical protein
VIASSWSTLTPLETGHDGEVGSVDVGWDAAGTVYVTYSVPVNEERGVYLVLSEDRGTTWSEPLQVFDGAAAGFDLVGAPSLLTSANGSLHIIWKEQSIQGDGVPQPLSLYYTRSGDGGHTFDQPELVVEEAVAWREIVTDSAGNLHLLWQPLATLTTVWDQVSFDGGHTWQYPQGLPNERGLTAVAIDPAGRLHLVGVSPGTLGHWLWDGTGEGNVAEQTLLYSTRTLKLSTEESAIQEGPTQTLSPPTLTPATSTPESSSTPASTVDSELANSQGTSDRNEANNRMSPFTIALLAVALLLLSVLGIVIRRAAQFKDR